jgi:hypothetical protein
VEDRTNFRGHRDDVPALVHHYESVLSVPRLHIARHALPGGFVTILIAGEQGDELGVNVPREPVVPLKEGRKEGR